MIGSSPRSELRSTVPSSSRPSSWLWPARSSARRCKSPKLAGELTALILLGLSTLCALGVIFLDQLDIPKFDKVTASTDVVRQEKMQLAVDMVIEANEKTKNIVQAFALLSVLTSTAAGVASGMALMLK
jgi:hypothetical protein